MHKFNNSKRKGSRRRVIAPLAYQGFEYLGPDDTSGLLRYRNLQNGAVHLTSWNPKTPVKVFPATPPLGAQLDVWFAGFKALFFPGVIGGAF